MRFCSWGGVKALLLPLAAVGVFSFSSAEASLQTVTGNSLVINDTDLNVSWTQDANLFKTQADNFAGGASAFVAAVVSSVGGKIVNTPNQYDTPPNSGTYNVSALDFNTSLGTMTWWGAKAWVNYLNTIAFGGVTGWRLPTTIDTGIPGCDFANTKSGSDCGYNVDTASSELAHLFYTDLGNLSANDPSGTFRGGASGVNWGLVNSGPFQNVQNADYWSGTEYGPDSSAAWSFFTSIGYQTRAFKWQRDQNSINVYGWAVRDGQVSAAPIPASVWLLGSALIGLSTTRRRYGV